MREEINYKQIVSVIRNDFRIDNEYTLQSGKFLGIRYREPYFKSNILGELTLEELRKSERLTFIDGKVYRYPYVKIILSNGNVRIINFKTNEEMNKYAEHLSKAINLHSIPTSS